MRTSSAVPPVKGCAETSSRPWREIETDEADQVFAQLALLGHRKRAVEGKRRGLAPLLFHDAAEQARQEAAQLGEQRVDALGAAARLELVEQRVVDATCRGPPPWPRRPDA